MTDGTRVRETRRAMASASAHALDGDGVYWRARQEAREAAERQLYEDPADGVRLTLRQHLDRYRVAGLSEAERAVRLQKCRPVDD